MRAVLISTYDLGRQPFGLASPAAWLNSAGAEVTCADLALRPLDDYVPMIAAADLVAFHLPMHTATKLAVPVIRRVNQLNPKAHVCAYGIYAPVNERYLRGLSVDTILGGEFEQGLVDLCWSLSEAVPVQPPLVSLSRQRFQLPYRSDMPPLSEYARLQLGQEDSRIAGYTEATRGCKHTCRHCPIVPVYNGRFRVVQHDVALADIGQQVAAGARHITFGDPDFFNGPGHSMPLVKELHRTWPDVTYDVTIKVEHLLKYERYLPILHDTGCLFVTSAVESIDDRVLDLLNKGHTRADFEAVVSLCRRVGLLLVPTFVSFTPWTTAKGYAEMLAAIDNLGLIEHVAPIQYAIRLLIPAGSRLLELAEVQELVQPFDESALVYPWAHQNPQIDALYEGVYRLVKANRQNGESRQVHFERVWGAASDLLEDADIPARIGPRDSAPIPVLEEDWY